MASVAHFLSDVKNIICEIDFSLAAAEEDKVKQFLNARTIQRIFRGFITRKYLLLLHQSATCIQKNWRAFIDRVIYRAMLKEKFDEICWAHYYINATIIQKCWKGYWIRSNVFSYYRLKDWLVFITKQNKYLKCKVETCHNKSNNAEMRQREDEAKEWIVYILYKLHHLLRTHQISGIYSLPNTTELSNIEAMLKCLKYKDFMIFYNAYMEDVRRNEGDELSPNNSQNTYLRQPEKEIQEQKNFNNN